MNVRIDEAGQNVRRVADGLFLDFADFTVFDNDDARENPRMNEVYDLTSDGKAVVHGCGFYAAKIQKTPPQTCSGEKML